jgi:GTPase SAR1 family protein
MPHDPAYLQAKWIIENTRRTGAENIDLSKLGLTEIPETLYTLINLKSINLSENKLTTLPSEFSNLTHLIELKIYSNDLAELPEWMGQLTQLRRKKEITLNAWDFGGQRVYRPTHQLFFSAPAVYLVVWKPREGSQAGQVKEWIQLVKRREPSAKILVVATHGGPQQRQPDIDRQELWDLFGKETVVDFFFVEASPTSTATAKALMNSNAPLPSVAASLPEVGRSVPKSFADVRQALQDKGAPYLPLR